MPVAALASSAVYGCRAVVRAGSVAGWRLPRRTRQRPVLI